MLERVQSGQYLHYWVCALLYSSFLGTACGPRSQIHRDVPPESYPSLPIAYDNERNVCEPSYESTPDSPDPCSLNLSGSMRADLWKGFCLGDNCAEPSWNSAKGGWDLRSNSSGLQGIVLQSPVQGHFVQEVGLNLGDELRTPKGVVLFPARDLGKGRLEPDFNAYVAIVMDRNEQGYVRVKARDRQPLSKAWEYREQLLDRTERLAPWEKDKRYEAVLDGSFTPLDTIRNDYRIPFTETTGRLKILHHTRSLLDGRQQPFFYLSYTVKKDILSTMAPAEGWMDLAPLASWLNENHPYFVGLLMDAKGGGEEAHFSQLISRNLPSEEPAEESNSFRVIKRNYNWSGFSGDAWQVQFGKEFPASKKYRLVFWSEMNNVPAWHINDQLLLTNSFVELWPENRYLSKGCFEAMSDSLLWNNEVKIVADTPARKVIHWRSYLMNPAYQTIAQTLGRTYDAWRGLDALPRSDEIWTVYPDGSVFREVNYTPDQQGYGDKSYEIAEISIIAGTRTSPEDHAQPGASLELWNPMAQDSYKFRPSHGRDIYGNWYKKEDAPFNKWDQIVAVANLKDGQEKAPYFYSAFAQSWAEPKVSGTYPLNFDISWHGYEWQFSHWPVHHEPYEFHDQTRSRWDSQVSHSALVSVQVNDGGQTSERKAFVSLLGVNPDARAISARVQDWSYPPEVKSLSGCQSPWFNPTEGLLELRWKDRTCSFDLQSRFTGRDSVPLVLKMHGVYRGQNFRVWVNGRELSYDEWNLGFEFEEGAAKAIFFIHGQKGGIQSVSLKG